MEKIKNENKAKPAMVHECKITEWQSLKMETNGFSLSFTLNIFVSQKATFKLTEMSFHPQGGIKSLNFFGLIKIHFFYWVFPTCQVLSKGLCMF